MVIFLLLTEIFFSKEGIKNEKYKIIRHHITKLSKYNKYRAESYSRTKCSVSIKTNIKSCLLYGSPLIKQTDGQTDKLIDSLRSLRSSIRFTS